MKSPHVSLVVPFFNEELVADEFLTRAFAALDALDGVSYELICVNDGSTDATWQMLRDWAERRPAIVAVNLFRNFGHQLAVSAGLELASGDRVVIIDADLQDPPELIGPMLALMDQGADVVYGQRVRRHGETLFKRLSAKAFYVALSRLSGHDIPQDTGDFRVIPARSRTCSWPCRKPIDF